MTLYCCIVNSHCVKGYACFFYQLFLHLATATFLPSIFPRCSHSPQHHFHAHTRSAGQAHSVSCSKSVGGGAPSPRGGVLWSMQVWVWSPSGGKSRSPQQVAEGRIRYSYCREDHVLCFGASAGKREYSTSRATKLWRTCY